MRERRKFTRIPDDSYISYVIMPDRAIRRFLIKNISRGGIRFFVHKFIPKNSILKIRLTLKKISFSFEATGKVIWITEYFMNEKYEVGVEFINIPRDIAAQLIKYIGNVAKDK